MRIGNNMDMPAGEQLQAARATANYSKADIISNSIRLDITDIGKDTGFIIDQGRSIQDVIDEAGALDVQTQTDYMVVMSNTMSEEDYAKMCKDGFRPGEMTPEESVTILDHIKAAVAQSGEVVAGFNDDLDIAKLEEITGSRADANSLAHAMKQADLPINETNAKKINDAAREIGEVDAVSDSALRYMLVQNMQPTIENVYLASFSAHGNGTEQAKGYYSLGMQGYLVRKADTADIASIMPEIRKTVEGFGLEDIDTATGVKEATWLVERGLDITKTNIEKLDKLMNIELPKDYKEACERAAFALSRGDEPKRANLISDNESIYDKAVRIEENIRNISDRQVEDVINAGRILNLKNLWYARDAFGVGSEAATSAAASVPQAAETQADPTLITQGRTLLAEVRLRMTLEANISMLRRGIEIDTLPLSRLVDEIKASQRNIDGILTQNNGSQSGSVAEQSASVYKATRQAVNDIPNMPAAVIGRLRLDREYSLTTVHEVGTDLKTRYEAAGRSYETLMTAPRRDMGDSISKAFRNVDDILKDMGIETNDANRKAVRILGYNSMEINEASVSQIREAAEKVMNAVNALTPARTLELIRQGINPMEMNIDELTQVLGRLTTEEADEKYSRFLYKLEKNDEINESEREAYIGIYRLVNRLEKTDGAAIGALVNSDRDITFKSLLSGMRSSRISFNEAIDDSYGFLNDTIRKGVSISEQIEQAFAGVLGRETDENLNSEYIRESYREYMDTLGSGAQTAQELVEKGDTVTVDNMAASLALSLPGQNVFAVLRRYGAAKKDTDGHDPDTVNDSIRDYDNAVRDLLNGFEDRESARKAYASVIDQAQKLTEEISYTADNTIDLKQMILCHKQLALASGRMEREEYTVPLEINGEFTAVNLTLQHSDGIAGEVYIGFDTPEYGRITAHLTATTDSVSGLFVTERREGLDMLGQVASRMQAKLDNGTDFRVIVGRENRTFIGTNGKNSGADADIDNVDTKTLYGLAKDFLAEISRV